MTRVQRDRVRGMVREVTRLWQAWLATFVLIGVVLAIAPQQVGILAYKGSLIGLGGLGGYWLDRWTFPPIRDEHGIDRRAAMLRRALLMAAAMLASGLGA